MRVAANAASELYTTEAVLIVKASVGDQGLLEVGTPPTAK